MRAIVVGCAACALTALPSATHAAVPGQELDELRRTVGEAVSQAGELQKRLVPPATLAPAPAREPAAPAPAPAPRASSPAPTAAAKTPPARASASTTEDTGAAGNAQQDRPSPAPAQSSGARTAEPANAAATVTRPVSATEADTGGGDDEASLPFTGSRTLPLLLVAVLALLAGIGLRRAVRAA